MTQVDDDLLAVPRVRAAFDQRHEAPERRGEPSERSHKDLEPTGGEVGELAPARPDDLQWQPSYDRASVERFVADVEAERARLRAAIEVARVREARAKDAAATRAPDAEVTLGELVLDAHRELAAAEREHRDLVDAIRSAGEKEAARLLTAAHAEAAQVRAAAETLAGRVTGGESAEHWARDVRPPTGRAAGDRFDKSVTT